MVLNSTGVYMRKMKLVVMAAAIFIFSGCATMKDKFPLDVDQTAQAFFDDLQKSDNQGAYDLFAKGLSQRVSFDQFDQFMQTIRGQWGRIETEETALMPFHRRAGEENFIPLNVTPQQIKRYVFDVKFEDAEMNFDLTLAPEGGGYKIIWFSIWGSSIYMTPQVQQKIEQLFSPDNSGQ
jgi:hypothetical protein